jgi:topoisomerase IA-like protein
VLLKSGPYGLYVDYGGIKMSLKTLSKPAYEITLADVVPFLAPSTIEATLDLGQIGDTYSGEKTNTTLSSGKTAIRELTAEFSVRNGKYGAYVFYQKTGVKKPTFLNIKKFKENVWTCDRDKLMEWLRETYSV